MTYGETFLWHRPIKNLDVGVAYLWRQQAFRGLASYRLANPTEKSLGFRVGAGLQESGTGNPGFFAVADWQSGPWSLYAGLGLRTNDRRLKGLGGADYRLDEQFSLGFLHDGRSEHPYLRYRFGEAQVGLMLFEGEHLAFMFGYGG